MPNSLSVTRAKEILEGDLRDPEATHYKDVFVSKSGDVCGRMNAKNGYGGYVGYVDFIVRAEGGAAITAENYGRSAFYKRLCEVLRTPREIVDKGSMPAGCIAELARPLFSSQTHSITTGLLMNHMLTLAEIAAWQIASAPARAGRVMAALPALQRGAVWKVKQIEELWDSMLRRFPVGAFIVSPIDAKRGLQKFRHEQAGLADPTHHLLDGQQRATGIALGFADVWQADTNINQVRGTCWIDLDAAPHSRDVEYIIRV